MISYSVNQAAWQDEVKETMSKGSIFCIATSRNQAQQIVDQLQSARISNNISLLFPDRNPWPREGAVPSAGIGSPSAPGAGPSIAVVSGAAICAAFGGIAQALIGLGIPELEARRFEDWIKAGNILISAHTENLGEIARAKNVFVKAGAQDICATGGTSRTETLGQRRPLGPAQPTRVQRPQTMYGPILLRDHRFVEGSQPSELQ